MYRPCVNKLTGAIETLDISTIENLDDYIIVSISNEANWNSVRVDWTPIEQERPTRAIALEQEKAYEESLIAEATTKRRKKSDVLDAPVEEAPVEAPVETITE